MSRDTFELQWTSEIDHLALAQAGYRPYSQQNATHAHALHAQGGAKTVS